MGKHRIEYDDPKAFDKIRKWLRTRPTNRQRITYKYQMARPENFDRTLRIYIDNYNAEVTLQNQAERQRKAVERAENRTVLMDIKGRCGENEISIVNRIKTACERLVGKNQVFVQFTCEGWGIDEGKLIEVGNGDGDAIYFNKIRPFLYPEGSDRFILHDGPEDANPILHPLWETYPYRFVVLNETEIPSERIRQRFRDGAKHCIIQPLADLWMKMSINSETKSSRDRCRQKANQILKLLAVYPDGVPEDKMEEVAKVVQRKIEIHDILGKVVMTFNEKSTKSFHFTNTRRDHVEEGRLTHDKDWIHVSRKELDEIIKTSEWGLMNGTVKRPFMFRTLQGCYTTANEDNEYAEFDKPFKKFGLNAIKHPELNAFLKSSCLINSAPVRMKEVEDIVEDNIAEDKEMKHIDLSKAYTQHKATRYFQGFPGILHQYCRGEFDRKFLETHVGCYQFIVSNKNKGGILEKLGLVPQVYDLPSPEILYFMDNGIKLKVIAGCWGSVLDDIKYTDVMLEKDAEGHSRYAVWAGKLSQNNLTETYTFKGDKEWASHLKFQLGEDKVRWFEDLKMITVNVPKVCHKTRHHILAFITAYLRINMLETMKAIDGEIHRVICDGIYFKGTLGEVAVKYKDKPVKNSQAFGYGWYRPSEVSTGSWAKYDPRFDGNCILAGAGGTGKTTSVFNYAGLINPLYVVPTHELGQASGKYYQTVHRMGGIECDSYQEQKGDPNVMVVDELTMIDGEHVKRMVKMYPHTQIIIAGDIDKEGRWFQCRNGYPGNFSKIWNDSSWRFVYFETDYRALDDKLKAMKTAVRNEMKRVFHSSVAEMEMREFIKQNYETYSMKEAMTATGGDDIWICCTKKRLAMLKDAGIKSKWRDREEPGYTVHGFQGQTISHRRVFITLDVFEYAMLYTAISRVREFWQVVFVR